MGVGMLEPQLKTIVSKKEGNTMKFKPALCSVAALLACGLAQAEGIVGTWKTIDDETRQPKALVQITETGKEYQGKIIRLFANPDHSCPVKTRTDSIGC